MKKFLFAMFFCFALNIYAVSVENGLLAYYDFNSDFSDVSANSYDAVGYNGATRTTTGGFENSGALSLDGVDDYLKVSNITLNTNAGGSNTVSFWMKWSGADSRMPVGFWYQDLYLCSGYFGFNSANSDVTGISSSGMANQWVHVVGVFYNGAPSPATHSLYINGVKQNIQQVMGSAPQNYTMPNYFYMGTWEPKGYYFGGLLDEMMLFNRALTDQEVYNIYNNIPVPEPSPFLCFMLCFVFLFNIKYFKK